MRIFLVRHGEAGGHLTDLGVAQIKAAANVLKQSEINPTETLLLTSPLDRAVQSADILREELGLDAAIKKDWLASDESSMHELLSILTDDPAVKVIVLTSHMPDIIETAEHFARSFDMSFRARVRNGSVHLIEVENKIVKRL